MLAYGEQTTMTTVEPGTRALPVRTYTIAPRPAHLGGGWKLRLLVDGEEAGGGVFPIDGDADDVAAMEWWWDGLDEAARQHWMRHAGETGNPVEAYRGYLTEQARERAEDEGESWVG